VAIVRFDDPIFYTDGPVAESQYPQELNSWNSFESLLPGTELAKAMQVDNSLSQSFGAGWPSLEQLGQDIQAATDGNGELADAAIHAMVTSNTQDFFLAMREVAQYDVVRSMRAVVGQVATTIGFARTVMNRDVRNTYREPLKAVAGTMDMVNQVFSSPYFQQALDGITMIPIVGWIIRVVVDLLKLAVKIADAIRKSNEKKMTTALAQRMHVPLISEDQDLQNSLNQHVMRSTLRRIETFALWENFMPPHRRLEGVSPEVAVKAVAARDPESGDTYKVDDVSVDLTTAWYVMGAVGGGTGFIPGTSEIMRAVEFKTRLTGNIPTNTGRFLPTPTQACAYLWQTVQKGGPSMFMVPTQEVEAEWSAYVHMLLEYAEACVRKGFTGSETGYPCSDREWDLQEAKKVKIGFGVNHLDEFRVFLKRQFWARGAKRESYPHPAYNPNLIAAPDAWYYHNTVYAHALKSLRDRQMAIVGGFDAFLVTPMKVIEVDGQERMYDNGSDPIFRAFHNDPALVDKWETTIREVLDHPTLWKHVNWRDVPEGMYKGTSLRQLLKLRQPGMQLASQYGPPVIPGGPSDFPPPTPPPLVGGDEGLPGVRPLPPSIGGVGGWAGWLLGGALVLGSAGVGIEAYQRFGKGLVKRFRK